MSALISSSDASIEHVVVNSTFWWDAPVLVISSIALVSYLLLPPNFDSDFASASTLAPSPNHFQPNPPFIDAETPTSMDLVRAVTCESVPFFESVLPIPTV